VTEKIAVLFNPGARQGRAEGSLSRLKSALARYDVSHDLFVSRDEAHLVRLSAELPARYGRLAVAGGDTTLFLVVNEWLGRGLSAPLAILPTGSCNDVPRQLGVVDVEDAVRRLREGSIRTWDVGRVTSGGLLLGHFLGHVQAGIGVGLNHYVEARKSRRDFLGRHQTLAGAAGLLKSYRSPRLPMRLTVRAPEAERRGDFLLALAGNAGFTAAGFKAIPDARPDDGALDLVLIRRCSFPRFVALFARARTGRHVGRPEVEILTAPRFEIDSAAPLELQADGQTLAALDGRRAFSSVEVGVLPGALRIIA
jgi:diacylglycerol kinase family enzyme